MNLSHQLAKHFREVFFGGNWTCSNLRENIADVNWKHATAKVYSFNTIATLVYHISYYVSSVLKVLQGQPLNSSDKLSFNHPVINGEEDWQQMLNKTFSDAEKFAELVEKLPENKLWENFTDEKYGNYYRNIHGIIEHTHYHLGQIVILKKIITSPAFKTEIKH